MVLFCSVLFTFMVSEIATKRIYGVTSPEISQPKKQKFGEYYIFLSVNYTVATRCSKYEY